jgi:hypothetical protein
MMEEIMDEKQITLEPAEPQYFISPHPAVAAILTAQTTAPQEPVAAENSLTDLVQQAVEELRGEMQAEVELQMRSLKSDLRSEILTEQKGLEINVKT